MWALCVVLHFSIPQQCISAWPTEVACNEHAERWKNQAIAWAHRSKIKVAVTAMCNPPGELNAFKSVTPPELKR